jgi:hypothetical protein
MTDKEEISEGLSQRRNKNVVVVNGNRVPARMISAYVEEPIYDEFRELTDKNHESMQYVLRRLVADYVASETGQVHELPKPRLGRPRLSVLRPGG